MVRSAQALFLPRLKSDSSRGFPRAKLYEMTTCQLLLTEDHEIVRKNLREIIECKTDGVIFGEAVDRLEGSAHSGHCFVYIRIWELTGWTPPNRWSKKAPKRK